MHTGGMGRASGQRGGTPADSWRSNGDSRWRSTSIDGRGRAAPVSEEQLDELDTAVLGGGSLAGPISMESGTRLGRYLTIGELGRGGIGVVLRAYDPKLRREVALKVVQSSGNNGELQGRMLREAHAMAKVNHPNVVSVYDWERLGEGVLIVMEFVDGSDLRQWLQRDRSPSDILRLFVQAGQGLRAAHEAGLMHRDFKPANVLVTHDGVAKVTDFGLARMDELLSTGALGDTSLASIDQGSGLDGSMRASEPLTQAGQVMGTPLYMAPEQHRGEDLSLAVDQYAFCVSLWQALTGSPPFSTPGEHSLVALLKQKLGGPPRWPQQTPTIPRRLIEAIARGLAPDPRHRWPSMEALLETLTWEPRARRSRPLWIAGALGGMTLGVGGLQMWSAERCSGADAQLEELWGSHAKQKVKQAILGTGAPYAAGTWARAERTLDDYAARWRASHVEACEATTVRGEQSNEVMDLRMACLHRARVSLLAALEVLARANGEVVENAELVTGGLPNLDECSDIERLRAEVEPPADDDAAAVEDALEHVAAAEAILRAGQYEAATAAVDAAREALGGVSYGPAHMKVAAVHASTLEKGGEYEAAEGAWRRALSLAVEHGTRQDVLRATAALIFVLAAHEKKSDAAAEHLALLDGVTGADLTDKARWHQTLGSVYTSQGKYEDAEAEYRAALELRVRSLGPAHPDVTVARNSLSSTLRLRGKLEEAEAEQRAVLELTTRALGPGHPNVAMSRHNLAVILIARAQYEQARAQAQAALELQLQATGPRHVNVAMFRNVLASVLRQQGKLEEAEAQQRAALDLRVELLGPTHPEVAMSRHNLGNILLGQRKLEEARAEYRVSLELRRDRLGPDHPETVSSRFSLAHALDKLGEHEEAEAEYRAVLESWTRVLGPQHPHVGLTRHNLGVVLAEQGKDEAAEAEYRAALESIERALGPDHPHTTNARSGLAAFLVERNRVAEALPHAQAAWSRLQPDADPFQRAEVSFTLARCLWSDRPTRDARARARALAEQAHLILREVQSPDPATVAEIERWLTRHQAR